MYISCSLKATSFPWLFPWRWEGREKALALAGYVFILNIYEYTNVWIPAVNSEFWFVDWIFLKPTWNKIFSGISMWDSLFWQGRTANSVIYCGLWNNQLPERFIHEIQSTGFAAMHSFESRHFLRVFGRAWKAGSDKNHALKIQSVCGIFIIKCLRRVNSA